jgi:S-DNA-T family DNA segregation ATPase FtsK/SpoIIIE
VVTVPEAPKITGEDIKISVWAAAAMWLAWMAVKGMWLGLRLAWWLAWHPQVVALLAASYGAWRWYDSSGPWPLTIASAVVAVGLVAWSLLHPGSFRPLLAWPVRSWWRRIVVYWPQWQATMANLKLACKDPKSEDGERVFPRLVRVRCTSTVDKVRVRMLPGQVLADYAKNADRLAGTFEALDCRVRSIPRRQPLRRAAFWVRRWAGRDVQAPEPRPSRYLELWFLISDPLAVPTPLFPVAEKPNLKALPVALREDALTFNLRLLATHLLVIGATGSGKGSVLWSIVRAVGGGIRTGLVQLWVIDPKGGMEFAAGQRLFGRYCYGDDNADTSTGDGGDGVGRDDKRKKGFEWGYVTFLEVLVAEMRARQASLRGVARTHKATPASPHIILLIDEFASLTAYIVDREAKKRIETALNLILSQGRAVGITVIAAAQDPRKEVIEMRGLFPTRIALRLSEPDETDLVLRKGARDKGARCDEIPEHLQGIAYVTEEGVAEPLRVRFAYISDDEIRTMCSLYAPGTGQPGLRVVHDPNTDKTIGTDIDSNNRKEAA